jgi:hypothetical protein
LGALSKSRFGKIIFYLYKHDILDSRRGHQPGLAHLRDALLSDAETVRKLVGSEISSEPHPAQLNLRQSHRIGGNIHHFKAFRCNLLYIFPIIGYTRLTLIDKWANNKGLSQ